MTSIASGSHINRTTPPSLSSAFKKTSSLPADTINNWVTGCVGAVIGGAAGFGLSYIPLRLP